MAENFGIALRNFNEDVKGFLASMQEIFKVTSPDIVQYIMQSCCKMELLTAQNLFMILCSYNDYDSIIQMLKQYGRRFNIQHSDDEPCGRVCRMGNAIAKLVIATHNF